MGDTKIEWTDKSWNVWSGCVQVSPGCKYCYAKTLAERFGAPAYPNKFGLTWRLKRLDDPLKMKPNTKVFVNSMSDFFSSDEEFGQTKGTMDDARDEMVNVMRRSPQVEFQILTKRIKSAVRYCATRQLPPNVWIGVSLDTEATAKERIKQLQRINAAIRFISAEPLITELGHLNLSGIDWLIVGGESGTHLFNDEIAEQRGLVRYDRSRKTWKPWDTKADWVRSLRDQCLESDVAFFFKQWGGGTPTAGGDRLDGEIWHQFPSKC